MALMTTTSSLELKIEILLIDISLPYKINFSNVGENITLIVHRKRIEFYRFMAI